MMEPLSIDLPELLRRYIDEKIATGKFDSPSDYFRVLVERELQKANRDRLEALALEGLESGGFVEMDDEWWSRTYAEFEQRFGSTE